MTFEVIYPAVVRRDSRRSDAQRLYLDEIEVANNTRSEMLEQIFSGMNHGSSVEFPLFLRSGLRSLSVGDVVHFGDSNLYHICDSSGWITIDMNYTNSWLSYPRQYGCCSFELHKWADEVGVIHCMTEYIQTMIAECWP